MASAPMMDSVSPTSDGEETVGSDSGYGSSVKGPDTRWVPVFCTAGCMCHCCYIFLFLTYMVVFPLWCKWLLTAPMPFNYWAQEYPDFPRMPLMYTGFAQNGTNDQQQIEISPIPQAQSSCNYSCAANLHGYRTSEMNFDIALRMNKPDLENISHTAFPVILTSEDFEHWMLAADRRDAEPQVFFDQVTSEDGHLYASVQDRETRVTCAPLGSVGGTAPGGGSVEGRLGIARERREVGSRAGPRFRSEEGVRGSDSDESWHCLGAAPALHWYRAGTAMLYWRDTGAALDYTGATFATSPAPAKCQCSSSLATV